MLCLCITTSPQWGKRLEYGDEADVWNAKMWKWRYVEGSQFVKARNFTPALMKSYNNHGWRILPWQGITSCLGLALGSIVPWQVFITSREFNSNFSWKEGFWPKESTHALKREPNWRKKKMEPRRPTPRFIWGRQFGRDGRGAFERLKTLPLFFGHINRCGGGGLERSFLSTSIVSCDGFCFAPKGSLHHCPITGSHAIKGRSLNPFLTEPSLKENWVNDRIEAS